jgi:hypothetical protein
MKPLTEWQSSCVSKIANGILEYEAQQLCLQEAFDSSKCKAWVSKNKYPFGMRCNHPYKVWCQEMQLLDIFFSTGIACKSYLMWRQAYRKSRKPNDYNEKRKVTYNPDQLSLF